MPFADTETNVTSAIPIINAAAVAAVRPGFRCAPSASCPAAPPRRRAGSPTSRVEWTDEPRRASQRRRTARGRRPRATRTGRRSRRRLRASIGEREHGEHDDDGCRVRRDAREASTRHRRALSHCGDRRHLRRTRTAGSSPAASVTSVPTSSETTIVRSRRLCPSAADRGSAPETAHRARPRARAPNRPTTDALSPITSASRITDPST